MKKELNNNLNKLLSMRSILGFYYDDFNYCDDLEVNDCLMKMYFYILTKEENDYKEFEKLYDLLTKEQQEIVRNDYLNLINEKKNKSKRTLTIC